MNNWPDKIEPLLPFLIPVALIGYALMTTVGTSILRRRRQRAEAKRSRNDPRAPWDRWLDEINRKVNAEKKPGAIEKWRE